MNISTRLFFACYIESCRHQNTTSQSKKKTDDLQGKLTTFRSQKYHNQVLLLCVCVCVCVCFSSIINWLPRWLSGKESASQCRRYETQVRSLGQENPPWRRKWQPTLAFLPGESQGQRSLEGYSPWGHKSWT